MGKTCIIKKPVVYLVHDLNKNKQKQMKKIEGNQNGTFVHTRFDGVTEKGNKVSYTIPIKKGDKVSIFGNLHTISSVQEIDVYTGNQGDNIPNQINSTATEAGKYLTARLNYQIQRDASDAKLWKTK